MGYNESMIAISMDFVTHHNEKSRYMPVTAHFVEAHGRYKVKSWGIVLKSEMVCNEFVQLLVYIENCLF